MAQHLNDNLLHTRSFPAQFESLDSLRSFVADVAQSCGLNEKKVYAVQMAVDEAFTNIIEHSFGGECQESIQCTCQIKSQGFVITLEDCGLPFNPDDIPEPNLDASLEERETGGLGLYFMRQLMDEVDFSFVSSEENGKGCNILTMVMHLE
jgi:serine/threonine-protein kinase RsbW